MPIRKIDESITNENGTVSVSTSTGGWTFAATDQLAVQVNISGSQAEPHANVSIYGTPDGLRQLADLLLAQASVNQSKIPDHNCPPGEGIHATLEAGSALPGEGFSLNLGRLDAKSGGESSWFSSRQDNERSVRWINTESR